MNEFDWMLYEQLPGSDWNLSLSARDSLINNDVLISAMVTKVCPLGTIRIDNVEHHDINDYIDTVSGRMEEAGYTLRDTRNNVSSLIMRFRHDD